MAFFGCWDYLQLLGQLGQAGEGLRSQVWVWDCWVGWDLVWLLFYLRSLLVLLKLLILLVYVLVYFYFLLANSVFPVPHSPATLKNRLPPSPILPGLLQIPLLHKISQTPIIFFRPLFQILDSIAPIPLYLFLSLLQPLLLVGVGSVWEWPRLIEVGVGLGCKGVDWLFVMEVGFHVLADLGKLVSNIPATTITAFLILIAGQLRLLDATFTLGPPCLQLIQQPPPIPLFLNPQLKGNQPLLRTFDLAPISLQIGLVGWTIGVLHFLVCYPIIMIIVIKIKIKVKEREGKRRQKL